MAPSSDHIESPRALLVLNILNITGQEGNVITVALNVPSVKHEEKRYHKSGKQVFGKERNRQARINCS